MAADLAALAPSAIVCAAFLVGGWLLLRRELAPKRARGNGAGPSGDQQQPADGQGKGLYFIASTDYAVLPIRVSAMCGMKSSDAGSLPTAPKTPAIC